MNKNIIEFFKFLVFLSIGLIILYLLYNKLDIAYQEQCRLDNIPKENCSLIDKVITDLKGVNFFWILVINICFILSNISRAIRWNMLLNPMGYIPKISNGFLALMLGYFANLGFPRLGEVIKAGSLAKYENIPVEKVMGTIVVDRIMDVICLASLILLAFFFEYDKLWNFLSANMKSGDGSSLIHPSIFMGLGLITLIILGLLWKYKAQVLASNLGQKILTIVKGFWEGIRSIFSLKSPGLFLFHSIFIWLMYYLMTYLAFFSFEPTAHLAPVAGLVAFVFGAFGIVIPSPGGMGTYHVLMIAALTIYGIGSDDGFSFANIVFFSIQIFCNIVFGLIAIFLLPILNKNYHPTHVSTNT